MWCNAASKYKKHKSFKRKWLKTQWYINIKNTIIMEPRNLHCASINLDDFIVFAGIFWMHTGQYCAAVSLFLFCFFQFQSTTFY